MGFEMREDAEKWFKDIASHYPTKFDRYYLCLMAGFASSRRNSTKFSDSEAKDFVEYFPADFKSRGRLLVGLLIDSELKYLGIDLEDRESVYKQVKRLVDPSSPSYLSSEGMRLMNQYAHGGFDFLCEEFSDRPRKIEVFVRKYFRCLSRLNDDEMLN
ncbi:MAG: hypothetical protein ACLFQP_09760 [Halothece sp.]